MLIYNLTFRYIIVEINPEHPIQNLESFTITSESIYHAVNNKVQQLHGDFGSAAIRSGFIGKYCNPKLRIALIRVRHGPHRFVLSSLPFIDKISGKSVVIKSLYVGATVRNCFKFLIKYQRRKIHTELAKFKDTPQYHTLCKEFMDLTGAKGLC